MTIHTSSLIGTELTLQLSINAHCNVADFCILPSVNGEFDTWFDRFVNLFRSFLPLVNDEINRGAESLHLFRVDIAPVRFAFATFAHLMRMCTWRCWQLIITLHSPEYAFTSLGDIGVVEVAEYFIV